MSAAAPSSPTARRAAVAGAPRPGGRLAACFAALFGLACGHTEARAVAFEAPPDVRSVAVLAEAPPASARELGVVIACGRMGPDGDGVRALYAELARQTRALGGNALVLESLGTHLVDGDNGADKDTIPSSPPNGCGASCPDGAGCVVTGEVIVTELRGRAMLLSSEEREVLAPGASGLAGPGQRVD
jgi:hypothetical protein